MAMGQKLSLQKLMVSWYYIPTTIVDYSLVLIIINHYPLGVNHYIAITCHYTPLLTMITHQPARIQHWLLDAARHSTDG